MKNPKFGDRVFLKISETGKEGIITSVEPYDNFVEVTYEGGFKDTFSAKHLIKIKEKQ